jgi:hypothetical protein
MPNQADSLDGRLLRDPDRCNIVSLLEGLIGILL